MSVWGTKKEMPTDGEAVPQMKDEILTLQIRSAGNIRGAALPPVGFMLSSQRHCLQPEDAKSPP